MSQRFDSLSVTLRRLLLGAFYAGGALYFWLPSHEVFEGPKVQASLIYALALALISLPLLLQRLPSLVRQKPLWLRAGFWLLAATVASLIGAYACLPGNLRLAGEHLAPVLASAVAALIFFLESPAQRQRVIALWMAAHCLLLFYGLVQVLDQNWGQAHGVVVDLIRWTQFGQSRVYSSMGNPDYMAAHLSLVLPLLAGLGWRRFDPRPAAQAAALMLWFIPLALIPAVYGTGPVLGGFLSVLGPWALLSVALFFLHRRLSAKASWLFLLALLTLLIILAQGRGAYLALAVSLLAMTALAYRAGGRAWFQDRWLTLRPVVFAAGAGAALIIALLFARAASPQAPFFQNGSAASVLKATDALWVRVTQHSGASDDAQIVRKFYWKAAWRLGLAHPVFGVGFGNHALFTARAQSSVWKAMDAAGDPAAFKVEPHVELYAHNDFLQNWAETGLLGLAAFLFFWWAFLRSAWQRARAGEGQQRDLAIGLFGLAVAFLVNAQVNFPWRVLATQQLCWLAWALLALGSEVLEPGTPESAPAAGPTPRLDPWAWGAVGVVALLLALYPARWFFASNLFKQGNLRKDAQQAGAVAFYEKAVQAGLSGTQEVELYLYLGSMDNVAQRPDDAIAAFKKGLAAYPDFLEALYNLGYSYQNRYGLTKAPADLQMAKSYYEQLLDVDPRYLNGLNNLGNLYYLMQDFPRAAQIYAKLSLYGPDLVEGHYNLGATYLMLGDAGKALEAFEAALKLKPDYAAAKQYAEQLRHLPQGTKIKLAAPKP